MAAPTEPLTALLVARSEGGLFPHTHTLELPLSAIENPPAGGVTLDTSRNYSLVFKHGHQVHLSQAQLEQLRAGQTVTVRDTDKGRHSFTFRP